MKQLYLSFFIVSGLFSQPYHAPLTWSWTGRVHPELEWYTISTENFNIHYHSGIEKIARKGATISENVLPILLQQMELDSIPTIDIVFTSADQVQNGFATPFYSTYIWVDQNDAVLWGEGKKWLEDVIPHELQHIILFHRIRSWLPSPLDILISDLPFWVIEGIAEYKTEKWRPYRADLQHKIHVLKNQMEEMDPHHDGFSKMLYWSDRFGDSTIVEVLKWRSSLKLFNFPKAFKEVTGISVNQFEEDWRRHMNTYFYGVRSQKEPIEQVGKVVSLPIKKMFSFMFNPDSFKIALIGKDDNDQLDMSLFIASRDSLAENKKKEDLKADSIKPQEQPIIIWEKEEIDFGRFHRSFSWSPDGKKIAYAKYHFGVNQSSVWDIRIYDLESKKGRWLTNTGRATYPIWSSDGRSIIYVSHQNRIANLYKVDLDNSQSKPITKFVESTQIITPNLSFDGKKIAFAMSKNNSNLDLWLLNITSGEIKRLTKHSLADYQPVWTSNGESISFTSHRSGTPNIHTIKLNDLVINQNTDVGEAIWTHQLVPNDSTIFSTTLADIDTVRVVKVSSKRKIRTAPLSIMNSYSSWLQVRPTFKLEDVKINDNFELRNPQKYTFTKHLKHVTTIILPGTQTSIFTQWIDGLGRHLFTGVGFTDFYSKEGSGYLLSYQNAQHGPLWGVSYYYNTNPIYRRYDKSRFGLLEMKNGLDIRLFHPFNKGETLSSNNLFFASLSFMNRKPVVSDSISFLTGQWFPREKSSYNLLPLPESGRDAVISLKYRWIDRRPHRWNNFIPPKSKGLILKVEKATSYLFGAFDYTRITVDGFINSPIGSTAFFGRIKGVMVSGSTPAHDYVGLSNDGPIYLSTIAGDFSPSTFEFLPENHNPRGWNGTRIGNRLFFGSLEYRLPIIPKTISLALISDFGNAWKDQIGNNKAILTYGIETRFSFGPLVLALGNAKPFQSTDSINKEIYFRMALINPF
ncbi:MAG: hypothetical protein CMG75_00500 [Candidatus Marinimicrobia bacterium]|nr:hypothetical protein [Candidatus Neomarinimicrobiota bacterium]|tara:strand:- start:22264 stop:25173 length:2910 start_codon:yes stop_codon:yes gene_type:complete